MEIIHLILGKANPNRMNGVNKVVFQLATNQQNEGKSVAVWGITANPIHDYGERNFKTNLYLAHRNPFKIDQKLKNDLLKYKDQIIVHLHGGWIPIYASLALFLHKNNIKFVLTPHGAYNTIAMQRSNWRKKIYYTLFEKKVLKYASKIHSLGASEVEGLNSFFPNQKSVLIPYGFENTNVAPTEYVKTKEFIIGFVGRIDIHTKGLDILVKCCKSLKEKNIPFKLWFVGDGELPELKKMVEENSIEENCTFYGSKFGNDKNEIIQQMTIFTHPSRNEGIPTAVLEAASFGKPSVVTNATNIGEYLINYNAGLVIQNENVDELTDAFITLFEKWETNELANYFTPCLKLVNEGFSWKNIVNQYDILYN
jgi:glycosyltransferase involved in cell wall biosynthesis